VATTTPKPFKLIRELLADEATHVTRGTTYENLENLSPTFKRQILRQFEGTRLGRQELHAELLEDVEGALWTRELIETARVDVAPETLRKVVVAIDPAVSATEGSDETGIVAVGLDDEGNCYVLRDASGRLSPLNWAKRAVNLYEELSADAIVAEVNNGGDLVEINIRTVSQTAPVRKVHASRGKAVRAEPVVTLYEQGRVRHVGMHPLLEDQLCTWVPGSGDDSPDRMDALVWGVTDIGLGQIGPQVFF
jgi:phage terminase large subunit-like protein